jgi:hypothetical protein
MRIEIPERLSDEAVLLRPLRTDDARPYAAAFRADPELGWLAGYEDGPDEAGSDSVRSSNPSGQRRAKASSWRLPILARATSGEP